MQLPEIQPANSHEQRRSDRLRLRRAAGWSLLAALVLLMLQLASPWLPLAAMAVTPRTPSGLLGVLTSVLVHGGWEHVLSNAIALLMLGTLAGSVYPRATVHALPVIWAGSGLGAWLLGSPDEHHLGASGLTHGLMFLVFSLGLLRRERPAVAAGMIAFLLYGGMLVTIFPQQLAVSWQAHLGGALGGVLGAWLFRHADAAPPRRVYSWELEDEEPPVEVPPPAADSPSPRAGLSASGDGAASAIPLQPESRQ